MLGGEEISPKLQRRLSFRAMNAAAKWSDTTSVDRPKVMTSGLPRLWQILKLAFIGRCRMPYLA